MTTVHGVKSQITVLFGIRARLQWAGLLIAMDTGTGLARGAGPGLTTSRGALRHSIMVAGHMSAALGAGARDLFTSVHFTDRRSLVLLVAVDLASVSVAASAAESGGSRLAGVNRSIRGSIAAGGSSTT